MIVNTKAVALSSLKYGESSLIVRCFTEGYGLRAYLLKGVLRSKKGKVKASLFRPFSILELVAYHKGRGTLESIREAKLAYHHTSIPYDVYKSAITLFLSEVLYNAIREEDANKSLYHFLEDAICWLDACDRTPDYHLVFMLLLTRFLGFYPRVEDTEAPYFDMMEGVFTFQRPERHYLQNEEITIFKRLLGMNFDDLSRYSFRTRERGAMLRVLIGYFKLHLQGFQEPRSLKVLHEVFH